MIILKAYAVSALTLWALDGLWLGVVARGWLAQQLGPLMREKILPGPAVAFYLLYPLGIAVLAVSPALGEGGWTRALMLGALLGVCAYGTYDLTNWSTLKGWPAAMSLVDIAWGTFATAGAAAGAAFVIGNWWR